MQIKSHQWGTWVVQSVKHPTLGFGPGHDYRVVIPGSWDWAPCQAPHSAWSLLKILSPFAPPTHALSLSLSQINKFSKKKMCSNKPSSNAIYTEHVYYISHSNNIADHSSSFFQTLSKNFSYIFLLYAICCSMVGQDMLCLLIQQGMVEMGADSSLWHLLPGSF